MRFEYYLLFFFSGVCSECVAVWPVIFRNAERIVCMNRPHKTIRGTWSECWEDELSPNSNNSGRRMHMVFGYGFPNDFIFICRMKWNVLSVCVCVCVRDVNAMTEPYPIVAASLCARMFVMILTHVCHLPI